MASEPLLIINKEYLQRVFYVGPTSTSMIDDYNESKINTITRL